MRLVLSKGQCHAIFLLVHVVALGIRKNREDRILAARQRTTIAALSYDFETAADVQIQTGLVKLENEIRIEKSLRSFKGVADMPTLKGIVELLLQKRPPVWLRTAVQNRCLRPELIPSEDLRALSWLGEDLVAILVAVHGKVCEPADTELRAKLGLAGELTLLNALSSSGFTPKHVSLISDAFGYDVQVNAKGGITGFEVKTAVKSTAGEFYLSRNEFEVCKRMGDHWVQVEVVLSTRVLTQNFVSAYEVEEIRTLSSSTIIELSPSPENRFLWLETALFTPTDLEWNDSELAVGKDFVASLES